MFQKEKTLRKIGLIVGLSETSFEEPGSGLRRGIANERFGWGFLHSFLRVQLAPYAQSWQGQGCLHTKVWGKQNAAFSRPFV